MIKVEDYTGLAWYFANNSNKKNLQGIELDDLYQSALIGIWQASQTYNPTLGAFTTYAHTYMTGEVNNLVYKTTKKDGKTTRVPRVTETLTSDIDSDEDCLDHPTYDDNMMDIEYVEKYLSTLKLKEEHKSYFYNMIMFGDKEATIMFMTEHSVSKQYAHQDRIKVRDTAKKHLGRLA